MADFVPTGTLAACKAVEAQSVDTRPEMHALLAASYAAPLIELCSGLTGFVFNFYSERSGFGKTFTGKRGIAAWGRLAALTLGGNDTSNAIINKLGRLHSLPAIFDDPDMIDPVKQYRSLIYNAGRGMEKQRLTSDAKPQAPKDWKTFLIFLTNQRLSGVVDGEQLKGDATAARFLDFQVNPLPAGAQANTAAYMQLEGVLENNYGHLGAIYIDYVVRNQGALQGAAGGHYRQTDAAHRSATRRRVGPAAGGGGRLPDRRRQHLQEDQPRPRSTRCWWCRPSTRRWTCRRRPARPGSAGSPRRASSRPSATTASAAGC